MATTLFPKRVDLDTASINELVQLFNDSNADLQGYLFTLSGQSVSHGNLGHVRSLIQQRLAKLGSDIGQWVSTNVPAQYAQGMHDAARQQSSFGNDVSAAFILALITHNDLFSSAALPKTSIEPTVISPPQQTLDLHTQSVEAIMDTMSQNFETSLTAMARSADQTLSKIQALDIRRKIAEEASQGTPAKDISKKISDTIRDNGITALTDSAGRDWTPESYSSMLVNTKLVEARNAGMMNSLTSAGKDLVEVSSHGASDVCGDWEGEILSISGDDSNYPSVDDATADGLFHPNCQHSLNAVDPDLYPSETDGSSSGFMGDGSEEDL